MKLDTWYSRNKKLVIARSLAWQKGHKKQRRLTRRRYFRNLRADPVRYAAYRAKLRKQWVENRRKALSMYGSVCQCCGEARYEFLAFDHVNGGGSAHRKKLKNKNFALWLLKKKRKNIQVLCHNCNQAKGHYGYCPHERERAS